MSGKTVSVSDGIAHSTSVSVSEMDVKKAINTEAEESAESKYVSKDAYTKVSNDMHKYKALKKDLEAKINELQAERDAARETEMREKEQWKELYEKVTGELESSKKQFEAERSSFLNNLKVQRLKEALGGRVKDVYLKNANLSSIHFNDDGSINEESVHAVANEFKETFPEVIPSISSNNANSYAAPTQPTLSVPKSLSELSFEEKAKLIAQMKK